jgi:hypothetical protein
MTLVNSSLPLGASRLRACVPSARLSSRSPGKTRLELLAQKANEGQLTNKGAHEYGRFIELADFNTILCSDPLPSYW